MLNYFYWYAIIVALIPILYMLPLSELNTPLNPLLIVLILISIVVSVLLGRKYRKKFEYSDLEYKKSKYEYLPLMIIAFIAILEFALAKDIPLLSVTLEHISEYREFEFIPGLHVFSAMLALYYSTMYSYKAISYKKHRYINLFAYVMINFIMLLYNMRSFLMFSVFIFINLLLAKIRKRSQGTNGFKIAFITFMALVLLFGFGCFGNARHGYKWNDSYYIETIGLYKKWPKIIPKQYMWTYSYVTSPLANINYNLEISNHEFSILGAITQYLPESITKRLIKEENVNSCELKKHYFTVSTGYCDSYANTGFIGLIIFWNITMLFPLLLVRYSTINEKKKFYLTFVAIYMCCIVYMFFTNTFHYGGTSPALWLSVLLLTISDKKDNNRRNKKSI